MKKWTVIILLSIAQFVMVLDSTVMNVSISNLVADLNTNVSALQSAITFYTLTMAMFMLLGAKIGTKIGLVKAFVLGSIIYGIGSFITGISSNITMLFIGWSVIEGLGAILVIPAIVALIATNYKDKDRVTAFSIIGAVMGIAAAAGPLIGGFATTYLSWRYVFIAETIIMIILLTQSKRFKSMPGNNQIHIDLKSVLLSSAGLGILVFGLLQSKNWGWITPINPPTIGNTSIAPFGISIVAYMIIAGIFLLKLFTDRQLKLEKTGKEPLVKMSILKIESLKSGLTVFMAQYIVTAAVFFVIPIYLQLILGLDALQTGIKLLPLSVALILFSGLGTKLSAKLSPKRIVRAGQILLAIAALGLTASIDPNLTGIIFTAALFTLGAGLGLLASQLSNINMSSVPQTQSTDVSGLQGTMQNLGSSLGTALIGSILIANLSAGFFANIETAQIPQEIKVAIAQQQDTQVPIVSYTQVEEFALSKGIEPDGAAVIGQKYKDAQVQALKQSLFILFVIGLLSLAFSRNIPQKLGQAENLA